MINIQTFGAIDIGSNGIRLIITSVYQSLDRVHYKKISLIRVPIRLGEDVFVTGRIGEEKELLLTEAIQGFRHLLSAFGVVRYRACATSAMREASNSQEVIARIKEATGVQIEVISGDEEAFLIQSGGLAEMIDDGKDYLYVDVGGGSTELIWYSNRKVLKATSFPIGTVRLLTNQVDSDALIALENWLLTMRENLPAPIVIGSGGNINRFLKLTDNEEGEPIKFKKLIEVHKQMVALSYEEKLFEVNLSPHRADVLVPALEIFITVMKASGAKKIIVPKIGLADGIVRQLFREQKSK